MTVHDQPVRLWLPRTRPPAVFGLVTVATASLFVVLFVLAAAVVYTGFSNDVAAWILGVIIVVALCAWRVMPVRVAVYPMGVRAGWRWIPRDEIRRCEVAQEYANELRLVVHTSAKPWRSPPLYATRDRVGQVEVAIQRLASENE